MTVTALRIPRFLNSLVTCVAAEEAPHIGGRGWYWVAKPGVENEASSNLLSIYPRMWYLLIRICLLLLPVVRQWWQKKPSECVLLVPAVIQCSVFSDILCSQFWEGESPSSGLVPLLPVSSVLCAAQILSIHHLQKLDLYAQVSFWYFKKYSGPHKCMTPLKLACSLQGSHGL